MRNVGKILLLAGVVFLAGPAGCGNEGTSTDSTPNGRPLTKDERELLDETETILRQRCMRREGFELFITEKPEQPAELPYGNADAAFAREHGLGLGETDIASFRANNPNIRYVNGLPDERRQKYHQALNGDKAHLVTVTTLNGFEASASTQGCSAEAQDDLYGDFEQWFRLSTRVDSLPGRYMPKVQSDERYREALAAWTTCMRSRGHDDESPGALRARIAAEPDKRGERRAALAEAECASKSRLTRVGEDVERAHREQVHADHRHLIEEYQAISVAALDRAQRISEGDET